VTWVPTYQKGGHGIIKHRENNYFCEQKMLLEDFEPKMLPKQKMLPED